MLDYLVELLDFLIELKQLLPAIVLPGCRRNFFNDKEP